MRESKDDQIARLTNEQIDLIAFALCERFDWPRWPEMGRSTKAAVRDAIWRGEWADEVAKIRALADAAAGLAGERARRETVIRPMPAHYRDAVEGFKREIAEARADGRALVALLNCSHELWSRPGHGAKTCTDCGAVERNGAWTLPPLVQRLAAAVPPLDAVPINGGTPCTNARIADTPATATERTHGTTPQPTTAPATATPTPTSPTTSEPVPPLDAAPLDGSTWWVVYIDGKPWRAFPEEDPAIEYAARLAGGTVRPLSVPLSAPGGIGEERIGAPLLARAREALATPTPSGVCILHAEVLDALFAEIERLRGASDRWREHYEQSCREHAQALARKANP